MQRLLLMFAGLLTTVSTFTCSADPIIVNGVTEDSIYVGQSAVLSGDSKELGIEMRQGITAYFEAVNRAGGIYGRRLRLISLDDHYEPDSAAANTRELIYNRKVLALIGYVGTPTTLAALPIINESGTPLIGAFTGAEALRKPFNRNVFNVRASYMQEGEPVIAQLENYGPSKIALFVQDDSFGAAVRKSYETALEKRHQKPVVIATYKRNTLDVGQAADMIKASGAQGVAMACTYAACSEFISAVKKRGASPAFATVSFVGTNGLLERADSIVRGIGISQVMPYPFGKNIGMVGEYQAAMRANGYDTFSYGSMEGYIDARVFVEGLKRAGRHVNSERLIAALETIHNFDTGTYSVTFSPSDHNGSQFTEMTIVSANKTLLR